MGIWAIAISGNCQNPVILTVSQSPPLVVDAGKDVQINQGESVTLGGNPSANLGYGDYVYLWTPAEGLDNPTLANPVATPGATKTYRLTVTDARNCSSVDEVTISINSSGVETEPMIQEILCYPNPVVNELTVEMKGMTSELTLILISPLGKQLISKTFHPVSAYATERIPMQGLAAGVYYLQIISPETTIFRSILKTL